MLNKFNKKLFKKNDKLLLAISGGIDSMVMLHNLYELKDILNLSIIIAHVDHKKRQTSKFDSEFVKKTCDDLNIPFFTTSLEYNTDVENFHDYARTLRYEFFYNIAKENNVKKIVLAHNKNDNAETILMRLTRGSSFEGYRGILEKSKYKDLTILRPLLNVSRDEITKYQKSNKIKFREDESNAEDQYTRNRYRHHILPMLANENPKYLDKFTQFSEYMSLAYDLIQKNAYEYINSEVKKDKNRYVLDCKSFKNLEKIIQIEVIKRVINLQTNNQLELSFKNLSHVIDLIYKNKPHFEMDLASDLFVYKSYDNLFIQSKKQVFMDYEYTINDFCKINLFDDEFIVISKKRINNCSNIYNLCYNNLDKIFPITVRNRRDGDRIKTSSGTKKLKDLFINKKVPKSIRETLPLVLNSEGEIIWIPKYYNKKTEGNNCIYITYQKG